VPNIDARPQVVDIDHYAGDTLTLHIQVPTEVVNGRTWRAQVRSRRDSQRLDAEFQIVEQTWGADVILLHADCQQLAKRGKYTGYWDVQLSAADGSDPVTTLAYGELRIHPDVTRATS
jgi:hypothetical protein